MGKVTGFLETDRQDRAIQPAADRVRHFREFALDMDAYDVVRQAARCMDCGVPYCHSDPGCPLDNLVPDWNDRVYKNAWRKARAALHGTNNFPEFTGRICPAPCEEACTLNLIDQPVTIKLIEQTIIDRGWQEGWVRPEPPKTKTGKKVAIIGAGPAGLAAAQQLARVGHEVHVIEREPKAGGLLRYGIPDFKMEKMPIDRRIAQMEAEGVAFHTGQNVGNDMAARDIIARHDATLIACGAEHPRDPGIPGQDIAGVHFAMPYLVQQNRRLADEDISGEPPITAAGKRVLVVGGGDTASDCIGTAFRQGAVAVSHLDIRPRPPDKEDKLSIWPYWPTKFRTSSSQAEGADRDFSAATLSFEADRGKLAAIKCAKVNDRREPLPGTEFSISADLALLAIGFAHPCKEGLLTELDLALTDRGMVAAGTETYETSMPGVFAAGDMRRGQSLVVWAIREGRQAARAIDFYLMGTTTLPR